MTESVKENGTVKWFNDTKGYGFITDDTGNDLFVHSSNVRHGTRPKLAEGQRVEFERVSTEKGPAAANVVVVGEG